jgi:hypothetical protein
LTVFGSQVSDVDGTMIDENDSAVRAAADFRDYWENSATLCGSVLVYNTGRSIGQMTGLLEYRKDVLTIPDAIITAVGTKVFLLSRKATRTCANADSWCASNASLLFLQDEQRRVTPQQHTPASYSRSKVIVGNSISISFSR